MMRIHEEAVRRGTPMLTSDVGRTAEPFFARYGFSVVARQEPVVRGVALQNAAMRKELQVPAGAA